MWLRSRARVLVHGAMSRFWHSVGSTRRGARSYDYPGTAAGGTMSHMTPEEEIRDLIAQAEPGVNAVMAAYERIEGSYMRAVSSATVQPVIVKSGNTTPHR